MKLQSFVFAAATLSMSASVASANVVTQTLSVNTVVTDWNQNLSLNQFNPTLGQLILVTATMSDGWATSGSITNTGSKAATRLTVSQTTEINVSGGPLSALDSALSNTFSSGAISYSSVAVGAKVAFGPYNGTASPSYSTSLPASLSAFEGAGTFGINLFTLSGTSIAGTNASNIVADFATDASATLTITYTYTPEVIPVPEPGTLALLGSGWLGLALTRYRRS